MAGRAEPLDASSNLNMRPRSPSSSKNFWNPAHKLHLRVLHENYFATADSLLLDICSHRVLHGAGSFVTVSFTSL